MYYTEVERSKAYKRIFWFTNFTVLGMLITFPFQGYALFSITFSTLFLFASYFLSWFFLKNIPVHYKVSNSYKCIKASLIFLIFSSIGPWAIGGVMATLGNTSIWYKLSIYFYLHFQYNAWFILALAGIFFYLLEKTGLSINKEKFRSFYLLLISAIILSFFLSVLWVNPPVIFYLLAGAGAILQIAALVKFLILILPAWITFKNKTSPLVKLLLKITLFFLIIKVFMQLLTALPYFASLSYRYTDFVIGYLHLVFLGIISIALFAFLVQFGLLKFRKKIFLLYFTGFILSEILIFYKGIAMWLGWPFVSEYFTILVAVSSLMPLAIGILLFQNLQNRKFIHRSR